VLGNPATVGRAGVNIETHRRRQMSAHLPAKAQSFVREVELHGRARRMQLAGTTSWQQQQ
jgi:hypothetical protein